MREIAAAPAGEAAASPLRTDRLILVAGCPASGKSTFIDRLLAATPSPIARELGVDRPSSWRRAEMNHVRGLFEAHGMVGPRRRSGTGPGPLSRVDRVRCLVVHFDLTSSVRFGYGGFAADPVLDGLLRGAREIRTVTLWAEPWVLEARMARRRNPAGAFGPRVRHRFDRLIGRHRIVSPPETFALYERWLDFSETVPWVGRWFVNGVGRPVLRTARPPFAAA